MSRPTTDAPCSAARNAISPVPHAEIDDVLAADECGFANQPPLPRPIAAERQEPGDEVVAIRNRRKERTNVLPLVLG